jgi:hypothetical protein
VKLFYSSNARSFAFSKLKGETSMKRFAMVTVLACILSVSALAGDIPCDFVPPPPPNPPAMTSTTAPGDIPTAGVTGAIPCDGLAQQAEDAAVAGFLTVLGWLT